MHTHPLVQGREVSEKKREGKKKKEVAETISSHFTIVQKIKEKEKKKQENKRENIEELWVVGGWEGRAHRGKK